MKAQGVFQAKTQAKTFSIEFGPCGGDGGGGVAGRGRRGGHCVAGRAADVGSCNSEFRLEHRINLRMWLRDIRKTRLQI